MHVINVTPPLSLSLSPPFPPSLSSPPSLHTTDPSVSPRGRLDEKQLCSGCDAAKKSCSNNCKYIHSHIVTVACTHRGYSTYTVIVLVLIVLGVLVVLYYICNSLGLCACYGKASIHFQRLPLVLVSTAQVAWCLIWYCSFSLSLLVL